MAETTRILVAGTGPVGLIAALALAKAGFGVTLVGPAVAGGDRRTTALMNPSLAMLDRLGVLDDLRSEAAPLKIMRIVDATDRLIRSPVVTFRASEIDEDQFGLNVPNSVLATTLASGVEATAAIDWRQTLIARWMPASHAISAQLDDGSDVEALLAVGADGRRSGAREAAGIATQTHAYPQSALVLNFRHRHPHSNTSTEFHTQTGPFTQVPLPGNRSSLVWVVRPETAAELMELDDAELSVRIEARMQSMLGRVTVEPGRQVYPLSAVRPSRFAANRVALVGEAAHVFPPIGAQGLNLGIRDVSDLVDIASKSSADPGSKDALDAYDRKRRLDILARSGAVNLLNRSLLSDLLPAQLARSAGLNLMGSVAPVRSFFMREGLRPGSGFAALADSLLPQLRR